MNGKKARVFPRAFLLASLDSYSGATKDRKERKREAKRRRDAQRHPDSYERFKILFEVIGEQRQVVNLEDHRTRYALILRGESTRPWC